MITNLTFVNIANGFQKVLHGACAIKIPIAAGRINIRICREDGPPPFLAYARKLWGGASKMWFGVG